MFRTLTLRGTAASIVWGHRTAALVRRWSVARGKQPGEWTLTAKVDRVDPFQLRQRPLLFTAPRQGGFWCWPVVEIVSVTAGALQARLGPPEY
jgi:hypothetical protein